MRMGQRAKGAEVGRRVLEMLKTGQSVLEVLRVGRNVLTAEVSHTHSVQVDARESNRGFGS